MERVKLWYLPLYAIIGFIAILLILPNSRWIVLRQCDVLAGHYEVQEANRFGRAYCRPIERGVQMGDTNDDEQAQMFRILSLNNGTEPDQRLKDIKFVFAICKRKNSAGYWGMIVRSLYGNAYLNPKGKFKGNAYSSGGYGSTPEIENIVREACLRGEACDPNNCFFPLVLSGALTLLGDASGATSAYMRAGTKKYFDDYERFEGDLRYRYQLDKYGYRGNQIAIELSEQWNGMAVDIESIAKFYAVPSDIPARICTLRIGSLIMRDSNSMISSLCQLQGSLVALDPRFGRSLNFPSNSQIDSAAEKLQRLAGHNVNLTEPVSRIKLLVSNCSRVNREMTNVHNEATNMQTAWSAWMFISLIVLGPLLGILAVKGINPNIAAVSPYLLWLLAFFADTALRMQITSFEPRRFGYVAGLGLFAAIPKARRYVDLLAIGISVYALAIAIPYARSSPLATTVGLFLIALVLERLLEVPPTWVKIVALLVATSIASWVVTTEATDPHKVWLYLLVIAVLMVSGLIPARGTNRWPIITGVCFLVCGLGYVRVVIGDIQTDRQLGNALKYVSKSTTELLSSPGN